MGVLPPKPWQPEAVLRLVLWLFVSLSLGSLVVYAIVPQAGAEVSAEKKFYGFLVGALFLHGAGFVLIAVLLRQHHVGWREAFGFGSADAGAAIALATGVCVLVLPVALLLAEATGQFLSWIVRLTASEVFAPVPQQAVRAIRETAHPFHQAAFGAFAILVAPVVEEMLFRGVLYPSFKQNGWPRAAWWATSLLFALTHFNALTFLSLFVLSMALIWLYERTANLIAPIVTHSLFNACNFYWLLSTQDKPLPGAS